MDSIARTKQEVEVKEEKPKESSIPVQSKIDDHVEVPYFDDDNFLTDYFKLGTQWRDADAVFNEDLHKIDVYFTDMIQSGEIANSKSAVLNELKKMEKLNNLMKEERSVVKLEVLGNYAEFLMKNTKLKSNLRRYAYGNKTIN